jgi:hypothetical protein
VSVFGRGRICAAAGCGTILSVYNPSSCCVVHDEGQVSSRPPTSRDDRPSEARICGNPACRSWFESPNPKRRFCSDRCRLQAFNSRRRLAEDVVV